MNINKVIPEKTSIIIYDIHHNTKKNVACFEINDSWDKSFKADPHLSLGINNAIIIYYI